MSPRSFLGIAAVLLAAVTPVLGQSRPEPAEAEHRAHARARRQPGVETRPAEAHPDEPERLARVLDGLERGLESLRELGRREEYRRLSAVAEDVRRQLAGAEQPGPVLRRERVQRHELPGAEGQRAIREYFERLRSAPPGPEEGRADDPAPRPPVGLRDAPPPPRPARGPRPPREGAPPVPPVPPVPPAAAAPVRVPRPPAADADTGALEDRLEGLEDRLERMERMTERLIHALGERPRRE